MTGLIYFLPFFIMHSLTYVFIPHDEEIESLVDVVLEPFDAALEVERNRVYMSPEEIQEMAKNYHLRKNQLGELSKHLLDWWGVPGEVDRKGLYRWSTFNPEEKWDDYQIGGRWNGHLPNNVMSAEKLLKSPRLEELLPDAFLDSRGDWYDRSRFSDDPYPKTRVITTPKHLWIKRFRKALSANPSWDVVVVDIHL